MKEKFENPVDSKSWNGTTTSTETKMAGKTQ